MASNDRDEASQTGSAFAFFALGAFFSSMGGLGFLTALKAKNTKHYLENFPETKLNDLKYYNRNAGESSIFVKVRGKVACDEPIIAEISKEKAAVYERRKVGVWYSWRGKQGAESEYETDRFRRTTPFYIHEGNKQARVYIVEPKNAQPIDLETVHQHDEPGGNFILSLVLSTFRVHYPYKYIITESILPINREFLACGYVNRNANGDLVLTGNKKASSFFSWDEKPHILSLKSEQELIDELSNKVTSSALFGSIGLVAGLGCFLAAIVAR
eukprot:TRINITY_DN2048_c0_g1_i1.p1 TRINITY_DN2048_c0_g1~~TRINITY_DN2048_c0_g1_i1.p1  ORF type:complete len:283 (-),score=72.27 TRINITY_DN2048_c0_g1_i1:185-997(-)